MHILRTWLLFLLAVATIFPIPIPAAALNNSPQFQTIDEYAKAYAEESDPEARIKLFFNLTWHVERNNLKVDAQDARPLALLAVRVARDPEVKHARRHALDFLIKYPHPAIADIIYELISHPNPDSASYYRPPGLEILVRLHDSRAFPFLLDQLKATHRDGHEKTIRSLAELRDPRAMEPLEQIAGDSNLETYFEELFLEHFRKRDWSTENVAELAQKAAREERENARRAARNIQLFLNHNIVCPFILLPISA